MFLLGLYYLHVFFLFLSNSCTFNKNKVSSQVKFPLVLCPWQFSEKQQIGSFQTLLHGFSNQIFKPIVTLFFAEI